MKRTAVVLLNLGGPSSLNDVKTFLFNLFYDRAIINLPNPIRWLIAKIISTRREKTAIEIYSYLGGKSPILEETEKQRAELEKALNDTNIKVFISMRYSSPDSKEAIKEIEKYRAEEVVLLPLYPQYSTTTTRSSINDIKSKLSAVVVKAICCYSDNESFIKAHVENINNTLKKLNDKNYRVLFSAHSLPEKIIKQGDSYQWQVENTVAKVVQALKIQDLDYKISYQSKVTPVKWIGPSTEDEIRNAAIEKKAIVVVPIAFVSEHSETLVELDIEYAHIAKEYSVPYQRVPALGTNENFILGLAEIVKSALERNDPLTTSDKGKRICPREFNQCICEELNG